MQKYQKPGPDEKAAATQSVTNDNKCNTVERSKSKVETVTSVGTAKFADTWPSLPKVTKPPDQPVKAKSIMAKSKAGNSHWDEANLSEEEEPPPKLPAEEPQASICNGQLVNDLLAAKLASLRTEERKSLCRTFRGIVSLTITVLPGERST